MLMELNLFSVKFFITTLLVGFVSCCLWTLLRRFSSNYPPCNYGWIPFLGCALEFGKEPLLFINKMQKKLGPVFTIYVGGKRMTFLTEEADYNKFFMQSEFVDFQKAVHLLVQNAASITPDSFLMCHTRIHDMMKGKLAVSQLTNHSIDLRKQFEKRLEEINPRGPFELNQLVRLIMYPAVIRNLFGEDTLPIHTEQAMKEITDHFVLFDDQFEYGTQIPHMFLRDWAKSKQWLLNIFRNAISHIHPEDTTLLKSLYDTVDKGHAANYSLLMLWASLANAIPVAFWTVAFILSNNEINNKVESVIKSAEDESGRLTFDEDCLKKLDYIKCCFLEAIRIRSPGVITRMVVKPFTVQGYNVPAGDLLFLSPYWTHRNENYFPEPEIYKPERYEGHDFSKSTFPAGFVAFGGGRYMCPGRWYALMELQIIITMLFHRYKMSLKSSLPEPDIMHLVGVQQPQTECYIDIQPRSQ